MCMLPIRYVYSTDAGVMSIDIHPEHPFLVVVGLYDGNVVLTLLLCNKLVFYHLKLDTA